MHLRHREQGKTTPLVVAAALFFFGLLSKESAIAFPLVALAIDVGRVDAPGDAGAEPELHRARRGLLPRAKLAQSQALGQQDGEPRPLPAGSGSTARLLRPYATYLAVLFVVMVIRLFIVGPGRVLGPGLVGMMDNPIYERPFLQRAASALYVVARYLWLLIFPLRLSADYSFRVIPPVTSVTDPRGWIALCLAILVVGGLIASFRRRDGLFVSLVLFAAPLLPASNLLVPIGTVMAERLLYLPTLGYCLFLALLLGRWWKPVAGGKLWIALSTGMLLLFGARTALRNRDWRDDPTLFAAAERVVPESSRIHLFCGRQEIENGGYEKGIEHLKRSLEILPGNPEAIGGMGSAQLALGRLDEAEKNFREAVRINPDYLRGYFGLGCLARQKGSYRTALANFNECVDREPLHLGARMEAGIVHYILGNYDDAERIFQGILALNPTAIGAEYYLGTIEEKKGETGAEMDRFRRVVVNARPFDVESYNYLGSIREELGDLDGAFKDFASALALNRTSVFTHANLARHYLRRGSLEEARKECLNTLERNPLAVEVEQTLALVEIEAGHYVLADSALSRARRQRETDLLTSLHTARLYQRTGRWIRAGMVLEEAQRIWPRATELRSEEAALALAQGDYKLAADLYQRLRAIDPDTLGINLASAEIDGCEGRLEDATHKLDRIRSRTDLSASRRLKLALLYDRLGGFDAADTEFRKANALEPANGYVLLEWGRFLLRGGRIDRARSTLASLLSIYPDDLEARNALAMCGLADPEAGVDDWLESLRHADEVVGRDSTQARFHETRAEALSRLGDTAGAIRAWMAAQRLEPSNPDYQRKLANAGGGSLTR
jgi:tetratricopeptide (TPR) repeat protein